MKVCDSGTCRQLHDEQGKYCKQCASARKPTKTSTHHLPLYSTSRWQRTRMAQLKREPLCRMCRSDGVVSAAVLVDHIREISDGGAVHDHANLQSLCCKCHARKTEIERKRRRRGEV